MKKRFQLQPATAFAVALLVVGCLYAPASPTVSAGARQQAAKYVPVNEYDPRRDAATDIAQAVAEARRAGRNVLLEVGGKWCVWCRIMDNYFEKHADIMQLRDENFVTVKINFSPDNENKALLSKYPEIPGYPHIFVLDAEGKLLHSQNTGDLEAGKSYDREKMIGFLKQWSPKQAGADAK